MDKKEISKARLKIMLKKAEKYEGLWVNPDFQDWRNDIVKGKLQRLNKTILTSNMDTPEGQAEALRSIRRYQDIKLDTDNIFRLWEVMARQTRKKLKKDK